MGPLWVSFLGGSLGSLMGPLVVSHEVSKGVLHEARGSSLMGLMGLMGSQMRPGGLNLDSSGQAGQVMGLMGLT
jgi:hypothetical protein